MLFKIGELKLLYPFYLYYLIISISSMIFPFLIIYFKDLNFSFTEIAFLFVAYSLSMFIFEIPTGAFADSFSRKYSVVLGFIISGLAIIGITFFTNFQIIFLLFVIIGFGMTLVSGAEQAWVIDNLNNHRRKDLHQEFFIKSQSIFHFAGIFAPLIGAFIVKLYSIRPLWFIWGAGFILGAIMILILGEEKYKPKKNNFLKAIKKTKQNMKTGLKYSFNHKKIFYFILANIFIAMIIIDYDYWPMFLKELDMPVYMIGIIFSIISAISVILPFTARLLKKFKIEHVFSIFIILKIILLGSVLFLYPGLFLIGAGVFIINESMLSLRFPLMEPYFHKHLPKKIRATITSVKSMGDQFGLGIGTILFGILADQIGIQKTLPIISLFGIFAIFCFWKMKQ